MKKFIFLILISFFFVSEVKSQTWQSYSDSIYSLLQAGHWQGAYELIEITDNLLEEHGHNYDTIYADYSYRRGVLKNSIGKNYQSAINNLLLSKDIWEKSKYYNPKKLMFINYWIAKTYNTDFLSNNKNVDTSSGVLDIKMSDEFFLESIRINIEFDTINLQVLTQSYHNLSYNNFHIHNSWKKAEEYALIELYLIEKYESTNRRYNNFLYDLYRRLVICNNNIYLKKEETSDRIANYNFQAAYYLAALGGQDDPFFFELIGECGLMYRQLTDFDEFAMDRSRSVFEFADSVCDHDNWLYYTTILHGKMVSAKNDTLSLKIEIEALSWLKDHKGDSSRHTIDQYADIAFRYQLLNNNIKSIEYYEKAIIEADKYRCIEDTLLAEWHLELYNLYRYCRNNIKEEFHLKKHSDLMLGNENDDYYLSILNAHYNSLDYDAAYIYINQIEEKIKDKSKLILSYCYFLDAELFGHLSKNISSKLILNKIKYIIKNNDIDEEILDLSRMMISYYEKDYEKCLHIIESSFFLSNSDPIKIGKFKALCYYFLNSIDKALQEYDKIIKLSEEQNQGPSLLSIYKRALDIDILGTTAMKYLTPAKLLLKQYDMEDTDIAADFLSLEGQLLINNGNYVEAEKCLRKSIEIYESYDLLPNYTLYCKSLFDLSRITKDIEKSLGFLNKAELALQTYTNIESTWYIDLYVNKANSYIVENPDEARIYFQKAIDRINLYEMDVTHAEILGKIKRQLAYCIMNSTDPSNANIDKVTILMSEAVNSGDISMMNFLFPLLLVDDDVDSAFYLMRKVFQESERQITNRFLYLSDVEKKEFLNDWGTYQYEYGNNLLLYCDNINLSLINPTMYLKYIIEVMNSRIFIRSLLLTNSNKRIIKESMKGNDNKLLPLIDELRKDNKELNALIDRGQDKSYILKIIERIKQKEKDLAYFYSKNENNNRIRYTDLKSSLGDNEVFVEIVRIKGIDSSFYKNPFTDTIYYAAIIIYKDKDPHLIMLDNQNMIEDRLFPLYRSFVKDNYNNIDKKSYDFFMKKIIDKVGYDKTIFLSPDGIYNNVSIATLFDVDKGQYLLETTDIRIVSSARGFVSNKTASPRFYKNNNIEIIGNPKFDLSKSEAIFTTDETYVSRDVDVSNFEIFTRFGISQLPGTGIEINDIKNLFENNNWSASLAEDVLANETRIKKVNSPRVMHIATHGFFFPKQENEYDPISQLMGLEINKTYEHPLMRSGLLLSGAQNTIRGENLVGDNGVLTSLEARELNFSETELVVLSACETGVGSFVSGEGVYGLQRSILEAGAENVIMSLWKVDDIATQMLMTTFYTNWIEKGMTKRESLKQAQITIKNTEGYSSPYYWGAFVLIGK